MKHFFAGMNLGRGVSVNFMKNLKYSFKIYEKIYNMAADGGDGDHLLRFAIFPDNVSGKYGEDA